MNYIILNKFIQYHGRMPHSDRELAKFTLFGGKVYKGELWN